MMAKMKHKLPDKVQQQKEEAARMEAERLLSQREIERPAPEDDTEPTLFERLEDIDRRQREIAAQKKRDLAGAYLSTARAQFKKLIANTEDEPLRKAWDELQELERLVSNVGGAVNGHAIHAPVAESSVSRVRRSKEELEKLATDIIAFIHAAGAKGVGGRDINEKFGKMTPSITVFLNSQGMQPRYVTRGERAAMTYHAA